VRAFVGPRPVYSLNRRTVALEIAEDRMPVVGAWSEGLDNLCSLLAPTLDCGSREWQEGPRIRTRDPRFAPVPAHSVRRKPT
jgi:hypothetical protein